MCEKRILLLAAVTDLHDACVTYPSCDTCCSKLLLDSTSARYHCVKCGQKWLDRSVRWRYRLVVTVTDSSCVARVVVFGRTLEPFFGKTASDFHKSVEDLESKGYPSEAMLVDSLMKTFHGKYFYFGFKIHTLDPQTYRTPTLKDIVHESDGRDCGSQWMGSQSWDTGHNVAYQMLHANEGVYATVTDHMRKTVKAVRNNVSWTWPTPPIYKQKNSPLVAGHVAGTGDGSVQSFSSSTDLASKLDSVLFSFEGSQDQSNTEKSAHVDSCFVSEHIEVHVPVRHQDNTFEDTRHRRSLSCNFETDDKNDECFNTTFKDQDEVIKCLVFEEQETSRHSLMNNFVSTESFQNMNVNAKLCSVKPQRTSSQGSIASKEHVLKLKDEHNAKQRTISSAIATGSIDSLDFDSGDDSMLLGAEVELLTQIGDSFVNEGIGSNRITVSRSSAQDVLRNEQVNSENKILSKVETTKNENSFARNMLPETRRKPSAGGGMSACSYSSTYVDSDKLVPTESFCDTMVHSPEECDICLPESEGFETFFEHHLLDNLHSVPKQIKNVKSDLTGESCNERGTDALSLARMRKNLNNVEQLDSKLELGTLLEDTTMKKPCGITLYAQEHMPDSEDLDEFLNNIHDNGKVTFANAKYDYQHVFTSDNFCSTSGKLRQSTDKVEFQNITNKVSNELEEFLSDDISLDKEGLLVTVSESINANNNCTYARYNGDAIETKTDNCPGKSLEKQKGSTEKTSEEIRENSVTSKFVESQTSANSSGIDVNLTESPTEVSQEMTKQGRSVLLSDSLLDDSHCSKLSDSDICYDSQPVIHRSDRMNALNRIVHLKEKSNENECDVWKTLEQKQGEDKSKNSTVAQKDKHIECLHQRDDYLDASFMGTTDIGRCKGIDHKTPHVPNQGGHQIIYLKNIETGCDSEALVVNGSTDLFNMSECCLSETTSLHEHDEALVANSELFDSPFNEPVDFSTPGCHDCVIVESPNADPGDESEACPGDQKVAVRKDIGRRVQFDRRLRRVSSCQLMDIKMRLTESPVLLYSPHSYIKPCLKLPGTQIKHLQRTDAVIREVNVSTGRNEIMLDLKSCPRAQFVNSTNTSTASAADLFAESLELFSPFVNTTDTSILSCDTSFKDKQVSDDRRILGVRTESTRFSVGDESKRCAPAPVYLAPCATTDDPFDDSSEEAMIHAEFPSSCNYVMNELCEARDSVYLCHSVNNNLSFNNSCKSRNGKKLVNSSVLVMVNSNTPDLFGDDSINEKLYTGTLPTAASSRINEPRASSTTSVHDCSLGVVNDGSEHSVVNIHGQLADELCLQTTATSPDLFGDSPSHNNIDCDNKHVPYRRDLSDRSSALCKKLFT